VESSIFLEVGKLRFCLISPINYISRPCRNYPPIFFSEIINLPMFWSKYFLLLAITLGISFSFSSSNTLLVYGDLSNYLEGFKSFIFDNLLAVTAPFFIPIPLDYYFPSAEFKCCQKLFVSINVSKPLNIAIVFSNIWLLDVSPSAFLFFVF